MVEVKYKWDYRKLCFLCHGWFYRNVTRVRLVKNRFFGKINVKVLSEEETKCLFGF